MRRIPVVVVMISLVLISMLVTAGAGAVAPAPAAESLQILTRGPVGNEPQKVWTAEEMAKAIPYPCLLYTSPSPRDRTRSRMPSSA